MTVAELIEQLQMQEREMKIGTLEHNLSMIRGKPIDAANRSETTTAADFLTDATEIALAAFDDVYTGEYLATGATDNKTVAMRKAIEAVVHLCAMEAEWKPGDPRCEQCDNGILATWVVCPYCGHRGGGGFEGGSDDCR
jgi:hypothetical protein